jgi:RNA-binding protein
MAVTPLSSQARAALREQAHGLKPLLHVGKEGLTEPLVAAVSDALRTRALLKLKVLETAPDDARGIAHALAGAIPDVQVVQVMGRVATLYRPLPPKPEAPKSKAAGRA